MYTKPNIAAQLQLFVLLLAALFCGLTHAQTISANLGTPATGAGYASATGTQTGRLTRSGAASSDCFTQKGAPGLNATTGARTFDSYTITNNTGVDRCYTITVTQPSNTLFAAIYGASGFTPASPQTDFIGDVGGSVTSATAVVSVAAGATFTVVVHAVNVAAAVGTAYTVTVTSIVKPVQTIGPYVFSASTGASIPPGGTLIVGSAADDVVVTTTVPFDFRLYDQTIAAGTTISLSSNGNVQFVASGATNATTNESLPATSLARPSVLPFWDDLDLRTTDGGIYTQTLGVAPSRRWVIEWRGKHFSDAGSTQTAHFAVTFFEGVNEFQFDYLQPLTKAGVEDGASATVGVQATNNAIPATNYSHNQAKVTAGLVLLAAPRKPDSHTITVDPIPAKSLGDAPFVVTATSSRGLPVTLSADSKVCTVAGNTVTIIAGGEYCLLNASAAGQGTFATSVWFDSAFATAPFAVRGPQNLAFDAVPDRVLAAGGASNVANTFALTSRTPAGAEFTEFTAGPATVCTIPPSVFTPLGLIPGKNVTMVGTGTCTVTARHAGGVLYLPDGPITRSFNVTAPPLQSQTISFVAPPSQTLPASGSGSVSISASASSGLAVSFASQTSSVCTLAAGTLGAGTTTAAVTLLAPGTCSIRASQSGNASFSAATNVDVSFTVSAAPKQNQTITHMGPALQPGGTITMLVVEVPFIVSASSGLPVTLVSRDRNTCDITRSGALRLFNAGTCVITASQPGNSQFNPASDVLIGFLVTNNVFADTPDGLRLFVLQQYRDFLFREGDTSGVNFWVNEISAGRQTRVTMVESFLTSGEFGGVVAPIVRMNLIARNGAIVDYNTLVGQLTNIKQNTLTNRQIAATLTQSADFRARYGSLTGDALINQLYGDSLGRAPTTAELAAARNILSTAASPQEDPAALIESLANNSAFATAFANRVNVTMLYVAMLDRAPDAGGYAFWVDSLNRAQAAGDDTAAIVRQLIGQFLLAPEYRARFS